MKNNKLPLAYFITFTTYGTRLHGDARATVDPKNNSLCSTKRHKNINLEKTMQESLLETPFVLDNHQRVAIKKTLIDSCYHNQWRVFAIHVRTNHVHIVVSSKQSPELMMKKFKAYASRELKKYSCRKKIWTRHGSTRYLWSNISLMLACEYVIERQGNMMAYYYDEKFYCQIQSWRKDY